MSNVIQFPLIPRPNQQSFEEKLDALRRKAHDKWCVTGSDIDKAQFDEAARLCIEYADIIEVRHAR